MALPWQTLTDRLLGLLFPDHCVNCQRSGSLLCAACQASLRPYPRAPHPLMQPHADGLPLVQAVGVAYVYDGALRRAVHALKYEQGGRRLAPLLGELLARALQAHPLPADVVIPVPLHPQRLAERGFNQSALLAEALGAHARLAVQASGLTRQRDTPHQVGLSARQRLLNVHQAFAWDLPSPPPARVLLLDDVLTTGATMGACAQALRAAGAREIRVLVLGGSPPGGSPPGGSPPDTR